MFWERQHIEEWVHTHPEMLGEDLLVLSVEFDRFVNSNDRLDVLALDQSGNLVVIELKRDPLSGFADLQAIRYAAMISALKFSTVIPYFVTYRKKCHNEELTTDEARERVRNFVQEEGFTDFSARPRIILCSEGFSPEITTTVLWLRSSDVDITCVKITPYRIGENIIIVPKVIIPLEEAQQYLIEVKAKEEERELVKKEYVNKMPLLVRNGLIREGDIITLRSELPTWLKYQEGDDRFTAIITGKLGLKNALRWVHDGEEYSISGLTWKIFTETHPEGKSYGGLSGVRHWIDQSGRTLLEIADAYIARNF